MTRRRWEGGGGATWGACCKGRVGWREGAASDQVGYQGPGASLGVAQAPPQPQEEMQIEIGALDCVHRPKPGEPVLPEAPDLALHLPPLMIALPALQAFPGRTAGCCKVNLGQD